MGSCDSRVNPEIASARAATAGISQSGRRREEAARESVQPLGVLRQLRCGGEGVADLVQRLDRQGLGKRLGGLLAQPREQQIQALGPIRSTSPEKMGTEVTLGHRLAIGTHELLQKHELMGGELQALALG